ncbi:MAG: tRNA-dihydrouridine synthase family protein [Chloroflexi bacterium]|nr:tRNA-dihydrouridine synthase family protein [Chloroflexota bacterium]
MQDDKTFENRDNSTKLSLNPAHPILAPMDGVSDSPFRIIARRHGAGILYSEFINGMDIVSGNLLAHQKMLFTEQERPIGIQIFDDQPKRLLEAAKIVEEKYKPDFIDINFSCPDRRVLSRGAGAALLSKPDLIREMMVSLVNIIKIPITAKIRLGLSQESINYLEISHIIEDCGAAHLAVHARTADQGMQGCTNWEAIKLIKNFVHIPVIGNGDIRHPDDIQRMLAQTGCDAVMIGRGAIGNPWIFNQQSREEISLAEIKTTVLDHLELSLSKYGPEKGLFVFRKHFKQYSKSFDMSKSELTSLLTCENHVKFSNTILRDY